MITCEQCGVTRNERTSPICPVCTPSPDPIQEKPERVPSPYAESNLPLHVYKQRIPKYILVHNRRKEMVWERLKIIKDLRTRYKLSFPRIARILKRDHSTIIHLWQKYLSPR